MFSALIEPVGISVAVQIFVAVVLSWICVELYRGARNPGTQGGDALMLDLGLQPSAYFRCFGQNSVGERRPRKTLKPDT